MKKLNSKLFDKKSILNRTEMAYSHGGVVGGTVPNKSDEPTGYTDTFNMNTNKWDISVPSVADVSASTIAQDRPIPPPTAIA